MSSKMDELERRGYAPYNEKGEQMVDPTPVRLPVGFKNVDSFANRVREIVRGERLRAEAEAMGAETFEEADDFDVPDDPLDPSTPYEADFDVPTPGEIRRQEKERAAREDMEDRYKAARRSRHDVRGMVRDPGKRGKDRDVTGEDKGRKETS